MLVALDQFSCFTWNASCSALAIACAALWLVLLNRQPARRILIARCALLALATLPFAAATLPRWHLSTAWISHLCPSPNLLFAWTHQVWPFLRLAVGCIFLALLISQLAGTLLAHAASLRLIGRAQPPRPETHSVYHQLCTQLGITRRPRFAVQPRVPSPILLFSLQPTILIPPTLDRAEQLPMLQLALAHELVHARNHDAWFWTLGATIRGIWSFLPPVGWLVETLRIDQEILADQTAAHTLNQPTTYAHHLVDAATLRDSPQRITESRNRFAWARGSSLGPRVLMLVACPYPIEVAPPTAWKYAALLGLLPLLFLSSLCAIEPRLSPAPATPSSAPSHGRVQFTRLTISAPAKPGPSPTPTFTLPVDLPPHFTLRCDLWSPSESDLAATLLLGIPLAKPQTPRSDPASHHTTHPDLPTPPANRPRPNDSRFHSVLLVRSADTLSLTIDDQIIPLPPDRIPHAMTAQQLHIQPPPGRSVIIRDLNLTW